MDPQTWLGSDIGGVVAEARHGSPDLTPSKKTQTSLSPPKKNKKKKKKKKDTLLVLDNQPKERFLVQVPLLTIGMK